jgi:hypothetical protein
MTYIYTKTEVNGLTTLTNFYNKTDINTTSNLLQTNINTKEAILTFSSPLTRTTNTMGINLSSYSTTGNDTNYLLKTGGTMTGNLTVNADLYLKNATWHRSIDGVYRLYYDVNGISYYCCGAGSTDGHIFMNSSYTSVFKILNSGAATLSGTFNLNGDNLKFPNTLNQYKNKFMGY